MKTILFYDNETTGPPNWNTAIDGDDQPHIVQIGALLVDVETKEVLKELDVIVKPEGWEIPQDTIEVHGITNEHALEVGIPEKEAITRLLDMLHSAEGVQRVAYNRTFNKRIIRIGLKRFFTEEVQDIWAEKDDHDCAMLMAKGICRIEPKDRYGYKNPNLSEAYKFFTSEELEVAHNALVDTKAAMKVYFACLFYR